MNLAPMTARLPTRPDVTHPFPDSLDEDRQRTSFPLLVVREWTPDVHRGTHVARPRALKRPEKAHGSVWADLASGDVSAKNGRLQGIPEWRDPDSNRGHHDFQTNARNTRTRPETPANKPVLGRAQVGQVSRK